jgi:hypothetical protein
MRLTTKKFLTQNDPIFLFSKVTHTTNLQDPKAGKHFTQQILVQGEPNMNKVIVVFLTMLLAFSAASAALADNGQEHSAGLSELYSDFMSMQEKIVSGEAGIEVLPHLVGDYEIFRSEVQHFFRQQGQILPAFDPLRLSEAWGALEGVEPIGDSNHL